MDLPAKKSLAVRCAGWLPALVAIFLPALAPAEEAPATTRPATRPATRATTVPATAPSPPPPGVVELTPGEAEAWRDVTAKPTALVERQTTFCMVLAKVADLPEMSEEQLARFGRPAYAELQEHPERFATPPIRGLRKKVHVAKVFRVSPDNGTMTYSQYWRRNRPVWKLFCLDAEVPHPHDCPLIVFTPVDPTHLLPEPDRTGEEDGVPFTAYVAREPYTDLPTLDLAAVFYRIRRAREEGSENVRDYPVLIAWQLKGGPDKSGMGHAKYLILLFIVLIAAGLFYYIRRMAKRHPPGSGQGPAYAPRRDRGTGGAGEEPAPAEEKQAADGPVDPDLAAAAEEFRKRKEAGRDKDRSGPSR